MSIRLRMGVMPWEKELDCIDIQGTEAEKKMFYTSMYHTMINQTISFSYLY